MGVVGVTLRPAVPMSYVTGVPYVCALAVAGELGGRVAWPYDVVAGDGAPLANVRARAGYDEDGLFVTCEVVPEGEGEGSFDEGPVEAAVRAGVDAWAAAVAAGHGAAGPLAPALGDYFDLLDGMGSEVEVTRGGRAVGRGTLAGVDVWGRATVKLEDGRELEIAPEQAGIRRVSGE